MKTLKSWIACILFVAATVMLVYYNDSLYGDFTEFMELWGSETCMFVAGALVTKEFNDKK